MFFVVKIVKLFNRLFVSVCLHSSLKTEININQIKRRTRLSFIDKLPALNLSNEDKEYLVGSITEEECQDIFENQVNLDSSPGIDGITYRIMWELWKRFQSFRMIMLNR